MERYNVHAFIGAEARTACMLASTPELALADALSDWHLSRKDVRKVYVSNATTGQLVAIMERN